MAFVGRAPHAIDAPDPARQQPLAARVEHEPSLRVGTRDERAERRRHAGEVGEDRKSADRAVRDADERDRRRAERRDVVVESRDRRVGEQQIADGHDPDRQEDGARNVAPRVVGLLGERCRVLPADEQIHRQGESRGQAAEAVGDVARVERRQREVTRVADDRGHRDEDEHRQLEAEQRTGDLRGDRHPADHDEDAIPP